MNEENRLAKITNKIAAGQSIGAKRELTKAWRDAVPDLPIRFAVILVRLDEKAVRKLIKRMKKTESLPQIKLSWSKSKIEVWTSRGEKLHLGDLPVSDSTMLNDLGEQAKKYRAKIIEIKTKDEGDIEHVAIELSRPETKKEAESDPSQTSIIEAIEEIAESMDNIDLDLD